MILTRSADYALRALLHLARCTPGKAERLDAIVESQKVPSALLSKILQSLVRGGVVRSQKGYGGGYLIAVDPAELTLRRVVELVDGPITLFECLEDQSFCNFCANCKIRTKLGEIEHTLLQMLESTTISDCLLDPAEGCPGR